MQRLELVHHWLADLFPGRTLAIAPASADASFRRYFRITFDDGLTRLSLIHI